MEFLGFLQLWVRVGEGDQDQDRHQASIQWRGEILEVFQMTNLKTDFPGELPWPSPAPSLHRTIRALLKGRHLLSTIWVESPKVCAQRWLRVDQSSLRFTIYRDWDASAWEIQRGQEEAEGEIRGPSKSQGFCPRGGKYRQVSMKLIHPFSLH